MAEVFKKAAVIGTGLMGGSIAMALLQSDMVSRVACFDCSEETRIAARRMRIADDVVDSDLEAAKGADLVFIATPTGSILQAFRSIGGVLEEGAIASDVGSVKGRLAPQMEAVAPPGVHYVGGHPMTGSEQSGVESARPDLYREACYILTPTANTDADAFRRIHTLLTSLGAKVISMEPEAHDRAMATISHVPHLVSLTLMGMAEDQRKNMKNIYSLAAGGFRDMTRIAASSPEIWTDICLENREFIMERLLDYSSRIDVLVGILQNKDGERLAELFTEAKTARSGLSRKSGRELEDLYDVSLPVPDEPGVISRISTAVGDLGINIEDLEITHPLEGETGILSIKILGKLQAERVTEGLESLGYRPGYRKA